MQWDDAPCWDGRDSRYISYEHNHLSPWFGENTPRSAGSEL